MKLKQIIISIFAMFILSISAFASGNQFSMTFPEKYKKVSETAWYTNEFLINGNATAVHATVMFESSDLSEEDAFSSNNMSAIENSIASSEGFDDFTDEPMEITTGANEYRCIYSAYTADINGIPYGIAEYYFYSNNQICKIKFAGENRLFSLVGGQGIIETLSFDDNFFSHQSASADDDIPAPADTADKTESEENKDKTVSKSNEDNDWMIVLIILIPLLALCLYFITEAVYWKFDHGKWLEGALPDTNAHIKDVSSKKISLGKNNTKFKTTVLFSDGYSFTTTKTNREDKFLTYKISIDEELSKKIIAAAKASHENAVNKFKNKTM